MKKVVVTLYEYSELTPKAQQNAIKQNQYINFEGFEWWEQVYEDARENASFEIQEFDIDRPNYCKVAFLQSGIKTAETIVSNFGNDFKQTAQNFIDKYKAVNLSDDDAVFIVDDLEHEFKYEVQEYYLKALKNEETYRYSDEAIIGTFEANEYLFFEDGTRATIPTEN